MKSQFFSLCHQYLQVPLTLLLIVGWVCLSFQLTCPALWAQDNGVQESESVSVLQEDLAQLKQQLALLKADIESGEGNLRDLQNEYADVLEETNEVIEKLLSACLDAVEKNPSERNNVRTAMGILLNEADQGNDGKVLQACDRLIKAGVHKAYFDYAAKADRISLEAREIFDEVLLRQSEFKADDLPRVLLKTNKGTITVELFENEAPETVGNFISLVESEFYSNALFHRVIEGFMAQVGGPKKDNVGDDDPGYTIYDECERPDTRPHFSGVLSMAKTDAPDSGSSQFFITFDRTTHLDGVHTVFGRVIDGHEIVARISRTQIEINGQSTPVPNVSYDYIESASVIRKRDHEYRPRKVGEPEEVEQTEPPAEPAAAPFDEAKKTMEEVKEPVTGSDTDADGEQETQTESESKSEPAETDSEDESPDDSASDEPSGEVSDDGQDSAIDEETSDKEKTDDSDS